jgi:carbamoyltransferase
MNILGISDVTGNHSHSCVALMQDGKLEFALSQERMSRVKNDGRFPHEALQALFNYSGSTYKDIDFFACGYPPADYYGSLMQYSKIDLPRSFANVMLFRPFQLSKYLLPNIRKALFDPKSSNGLFDAGIPQEKFKFYDHHLSHISAGYFSSEFDDCIGISYGGFAPHINGQNVAGAVYRCLGEKISWLEDIPMQAAGCYFSGVAVALGFTYMQQEAKTMGLAGFGDPTICYDELKTITTQFINNKWEPYSYWIDYIMSPRKNVFLGTKSGRKLVKLIEKHGAENVAAAAQKLWQDNILRFVEYLSNKYKTFKFVLSGGTFLNVQIVKSILELPQITNVYLHPHTGDGSTTIGAMIEAHRELTGHPARIPLKDVGLGCEYSDQKIEDDIRRVGGPITYSKEQNIPKYVAEQIARKKVIGWFQGREEFGHRSLGHRCILGDPRYPEVKEKITTLVKGRDRFIPISPSVLAEKGAEYFKDFGQTPFKTRAYDAVASSADKIPAALHVDGTARAQAVSSTHYKSFRKLIENFYDITGIPMVLNTSFNRHGEPIVHEPLEAIKMFKETKMDELAIGPFILTKEK